MATASEPLPAPTRPARLSAPIWALRDTRPSITWAATGCPAAPTATSGTVPGKRSLPAATRAAPQLPAGPRLKCGQAALTRPLLRTEPASTRWASTVLLESAWRCPYPEMAALAAPLLARISQTRDCSAYRRSSGWIPGPLRSAWSDTKARRRPSSPSGKRASSTCESISSPSTCLAPCCPANSWRSFWNSPTTRLTPPPRPT